MRAGLRPATRWISGPYPSPHRMILHACVQAGLRPTTRWVNAFLSELQAQLADPVPPPAPRAAGGSRGRSLSARAAPRWPPDASVGDSGGAAGREGVAEAGARARAARAAAAAAAAEAREAYEAAGASGGWSPRQLSLVACSLAKLRVPVSAKARAEGPCTAPHPFYFPPLLRRTPAYLHACMGNAWARRYSHMRVQSPYAVHLGARRTMCPS